MPSLRSPSLLLLIRGHSCPEIVTFIMQLVFLLHLSCNTIKCTVCRALLEAILVVDRQYEQMECQQDANLHAHDGASA